MSIKYIVDVSKYYLIPGKPITYWISDNKAHNFGFEISRIINCRTGLICGNNEKYIRYWHEVSNDNINYSCGSLANTSSITWYPYNHGGEKRRWYGGHYEVVNLSNNALSIKQEKNSMLRNSDYYFMKGITWNRVGSGIKFAARIAEKGFAFDDVSPSGFVESKNLLSVLGYMNSKVFNEYLRLFCTALKVEIGHIGKVPYKETGDKDINKIVEINIEKAKLDWDSFETSWDFKKHPLI